MNGGRGQGIPCNNSGFTPPMISTFIAPITSSYPVSLLAPANNYSHHCQQPCLYPSHSNIGPSPQQSNTSILFGALNSPVIDHNTPQYGFPMPQFLENIPNDLSNSILTQTVDGLLFSATQELSHQITQLFHQQLSGFQDRNVDLINSLRQENSQMRAAHAGFKVVNDLKLEALNQKLQEASTNAQSSIMDNQILIGVLDNYKMKAANLQSEKDELVNTILSFEDEKKKELEQLKAENESLTSELNDRNWEAEDLKRKQANVDNSASKIKELTKQKSELEKENAALKLQLKNERAKNEQDRQDNRLLKDELVRTRARNEAKKYIDEIHKLTSQRAEIDEVQTKLEDMKKILQIKLDEGQNLQPKYGALVTQSAAEKLENEKEKAKYNPIIQKAEEIIEELKKNKEKVDYQIASMSWQNGGLERTTEKEEKKKREKREMEGTLEKVTVDYSDLLGKKINHFMKSLNINTSQENTKTKFAGAGCTSTSVSSLSSCLPSTSRQTMGGSNHAGVKRVLPQRHRTYKRIKRGRPTAKGEQETKDDQQVLVVNDEAVIISDSE